MRNLSTILLAAAGAAMCIAANAESLPKSGSFDIHTGWKVTGEAFEVAEKRTQGHGSAIGTTFNDAGSGPLHFGPASCFYTFFLAEGAVKNQGFCTFGDPDGDRLFTQFSGANATDGTAGTNTILGGTGKYAGIQGKGTWKSKDNGPNGQHVTTQHFEYRLP